MWKRTRIMIIGLTVLILLLSSHDAMATGFVTLTPGIKFVMACGTITVSNTQNLNRVTLNATTGSVVFNVTGFEFTQKVYSYVVTTTGSCTLTAIFIGGPPSQVISNGLVSGYPFYFNGRETIGYVGALIGSIVTGLTVIYGSISESQKVLFRDDFLYTNPLIESAWTIDQYTNPGQNSGEYTSSGYLVMKASSIGIDTVHVTSPTFNPGQYSNGTSVKRKMTVALIPFAKTETPFTASITAGMSPLLTGGGYPGTTPSGTPSIGNGGSCTGNAIGSNYMTMDNSGTVAVTTCGDGGKNIPNLESGLNPSLYTVFTVETYGIFCSTCSDNAYTGSSWVWFRAYQEDSTGKVIAATDNNLNFTANVAPLFQSTYAFVSQTNSNAGATGQLSKIDFVSVQNYGSPVCLVAPAGFLCSRLPLVPNGIIGSNGLVGLLAWLANQIGFGDEQAGALILFFAMFFGAAFIPYFFTRNLSVGAFGGLLTLGFFTYAGFLPIFTLIIVFMGGAAIVVMLVNRVIGGNSIGGGGDME